MIKQRYAFSAAAPCTCQDVRSRVQDQGAGFGSKERVGGGGIGSQEWSGAREKKHEQPAARRQDKTMAPTYRGHEQPCTWAQQL
jgi:hypothetical protein